MPSNTMPPCPVCQTNRHVGPHDGDLFFCGRCKGMFDGNPDEGGSHWNDPSKRMEKQEEQRQREMRRRFGGRRPF